VIEKFKSGAPHKPPMVKLPQVSVEALHMIPRPISVEMCVSEDIRLASYVKRDEGASDEHEEMKMLVVECLARELGAKSEEETVQMLKEGKIETEHELHDRERVDVYVNVSSRQRYIEVETFYGSEDPIIKKLVKEKLSKYEGIARQVDIVLLTGLQALSTLAGYLSWQISTARRSA
jgi:iron only hydrogenase large subunit-like protein